MTERPTVFTEQEQLQLVELDKQAKGFNSFKLAVARSLSAGQDSTVISNLLQFLSKMEQQATKQIEDVKASAQQRQALEGK